MAILTPRSRGAAAGSAAGPATPPSARRATRFHHLSLLLAYAGLLWLGRNMWFRLDEWHIVLQNARGTRLGDILQPFDVHWSSLPVLYFRIVGAVTGASGYLQYMGFTLALYVLDVHLAWRVMRRCGVDPWVASLAAAAVLVLATGWESMYWVLMLAYTLPIAFTLGAVLVADRDDLRPRHRAAIALLATLSAMCIGPGVAMMVVPAIVVALRRGVRQGLAVVAPAALVYAVWLEVFGRAILDHPGGASGGMAGTLLRFVWDGLGGAMAGLVGPQALGSAALVALGVWMAVRWRRIGIPPPVPACAAGAAAVFVLTAVGRANGGSATLPHYLSTGTVLLLPAIGLAAGDVLAWLRRRPLPRADLLAWGVVGTALLALIAHGAGELVGAASSAAAEDQASRQVLLAAAALAAREPALPEAQPENDLGWAVSVADLDRLRRAGEITPPANLPAALADEVRLRIRVAISAHPVPTTAPPQVVAADGATLHPEGSCTVATASGEAPYGVAVHFPGSAALRIEPVTPEELQVYLRGGVAAPSDLSRPLLLLPPGEARYLDVIQPGATVVLRLSAGTVRLCG